MERIRQVRDSELPAEVLAEREIRRRKHEIDAQIVNAIEKGNPVKLLLTHPAGLMGAGSCKHLNADPAQEKAYIMARYADLKGRFDAGEEFAELDAAITGEVAAGKRIGDSKLDRLAEIKVRCTKARRGEFGPEAQKFARARGHKDLSEALYQEWAVGAGVLRELTDAELLAEQLEREARTVEAMNATRAELGMKPIILAEG